MSDVAAGKPSRVLVISSCVRVVCGFSVIINMNKRLIHYRNLGIRCLSFVVQSCTFGILLAHGGWAHWGEQAERNHRKHHTQQEYCRRVDCDGLVVYEAV